MSINLHLPANLILKPCITVFGVGGAGGNAVNNMINSKLEGAKFVVANTDAQALEYSIAERKIQLGENITRGLGAGASPQVGGAAAEESMQHILDNLQGSNMVFITAGMGGGTGTGAAPVIAKVARELGILTVGVVTKPFHFEGSHRMKVAEYGLQELQKFVDTLIIIPNQNLFRIANEKTTFADAFRMADDVLHAGVRGVTDLMIMPGLINLDFADIRAVMSEMGKAMMGTGEAEGEKRAIFAAEAAISNPLLDHCSMKGARGVLINITGGMDMTLFEVDEAANRIRDEVDADANIIFGSTFNPALEGKIRVSVVATGIDSPNTQPSVSMSVQSQFAPVNNTFIAPQPVIAAVSEESLMPQPVQEFATLNFPVQHQDEEEVDLAQHFQKPSESFDSSPYVKKEPVPEVSEQVQFVPRPMVATKAPENNPRNSLGIFGRMASSVGLRNNPAPTAKEELIKAQLHYEQHGNYTTNDSNLKESDYDIPAFLRRKK